MGRPPIKQPSETQTSEKRALPELSTEKRLSDLEEWKKDATNELRMELKKMNQIEYNIKTSIIEYNFQTVALIVALMALIVVVPLGLITRFDLTDTVKINLILTVLIVIMIQLIALLGLWVVKTYNKKGKIDGNA